MTLTLKGNGDNADVYGCVGSTSHPRQNPKARGIQS